MENQAAYVTLETRQSRINRALNLSFGSKLKSSTNEIIIKQRY